MSEVSQGPGWWQASDLKWYPPERRAGYLPPPPVELPPLPNLPPPPEGGGYPTQGPTGQRKVGLFIAGLIAWFALAVAVLTVAQMSVGMLGGLLVLVLIVVAIGIGVTIAFRSSLRLAFKIGLPISMVLLVLLAAQVSGFLHIAHFEKNPSPPSSRSASYQAGYASGESGNAHNFLVETGNGVNGPDVAADSACSTAFTPAQMLDASLVESEYEAGCHAALRDHPVMGGRPSGG
jgi:hypothetical protein